MKTSIPRRVTPSLFSDSFSSNQKTYKGLYIIYKWVKVVIWETVMDEKELKTYGFENNGTILVKFKDRKLKINNFELVADSVSFIIGDVVITPSYGSFVVKGKVKEIRSKYIDDDFIIKKVKVEPVKDGKDCDDTDADCYYSSVM